MKSACRGDPADPGTPGLSHADRAACDARCAQKELKAEAVDNPDWSEYYLDYKALKQVLSQLSPPNAEPQSESNAQVGRASRALRPHHVANRTRRLLSPCFCLVSSRPRSSATLHFPPAHLPFRVSVRLCASLCVSVSLHLTRRWPASHFPLAASRRIRAQLEGLFLSSLLLQIRKVGQFYNEKAREYSEHFDRCGLPRRTRAANARRTRAANARRTRAANARPTRAANARRKRAPHSRHKRAPHSLSLVGESLVPLVACLRRRISPLLSPASPCVMSVLVCSNEERPTTIGGVLSQLISQPLVPQETRQALALFMQLAAEIDSLRRYALLNFLAVTKVTARPHRPQTEIPPDRPPPLLLPSPPTRPLKSACAWVACPPRQCSAQAALPAPCPTSMRVHTGTGGAPPPSPRAVLPGLGLGCGGLWFWDWGVGGCGFGTEVWGVVVLGLGCGGWWASNRWLGRVALAACHGGRILPRVHRPPHPPAPPPPPPPPYPHRRW